MIVLLDANVLIADPFTRTFWKILGQKGRHWGLEIRIPRVSALETVGHQQRKLEEAIDALAKIARDRRETPGLTEAAEHLRQQIAGLEEQFERDATAMGAVLIDPLDVPHLDIVRRQTARKKPCKSNGDGFRDTLNWLQVLQTAKDEAQAGRPVVWISIDGDFADKQGRFHPELLAEITEHGLDGLVEFRSSLGALVTEYLQKNGLPTDNSEARFALAAEAVREFALNELLPQLAEREDLGLFTDILIPDAADIQVGPMNQIGDGGVWPFTTTVSLLANQPGLLSVYDIAVQGLVNTDKNDKPTGGEFLDLALPDEAAALVKLLQASEQQKAELATVTTYQLGGMLPGITGLHFHAGKSFQQQLAESGVLKPMSQRLAESGVLKPMSQRLAESGVLKPMSQRLAESWALTSFTRPAGTEKTTGKKKSRSPKAEPPEAEDNGPVS